MEERYRVGNWGGTYAGLPGTRIRIEGVGKPGEEKRAMGRFYPRARYLKTAPEFERRGCRRR